VSDAGILWEVIIVLWGFAKGALGVVSYECGDAISGELSSENLGRNGFPKWPRNLEVTKQAKSEASEL
jgi:hypothetical protein